MAKKFDENVAEKLGQQMKAVSVAEFFKKNKHLLGFDSEVKALLMVVKEAVDNSLDATEEYSHNYFKKHGKWYFPEIDVDIKKAEHSIVIIPEGSDKPIADLVKTGKTWDVMYFGKKIRASSVEGNMKYYNIEGTKLQIVEAGLKKPKVFVNEKIAEINERTKKYNVTITDNGPGIIEKNIPNAFGKLLYGSKFHRLRQSRGQQGIGISSVVLYAQQTTGVPATIISKVEGGKAVKLELTIADNNEPVVHSKEYMHDFQLEHGTQITITIEADFVSKGEKSVYEFLRRTSIVNPHATITFSDPDRQKFRFQKTANELPTEPSEIKPHPHGMEYGVLQSMLLTTQNRSIKGFLSSELSKVSAGIAEDILGKIGIKTNTKPKDITRDEIELLIRAFNKYPLKRPPTDCLSPIGEEFLQKSILRDTKAEFIATISRKPNVYKGRPFLVEAAIAYGGELPKEGQAEKLRYANKIPLLYDAAGCAITTAIQENNWKQYGIESVAQNGTPMGPYVILLHIASVWVPYTSEGKSAIANYDEIIKEMKLALQDCARKLKTFLRAKNKDKRLAERRSLFEIYIPELAFALQKLTDVKKDVVEKDLKRILGKGKIKGEDEKGNETKDKTAPAEEPEENGE